MSKLKRYYSSGNVYFVTVVTYNRGNFLIEYIETFWSSLEKKKNKYAISLDAWVILPGHFHMILTPVDGGMDKIIHDFKLSFGALVRKKQDQYRGRIWQSRFWDHIIRDDTDMNRHIDYIHYNPVKHGLVDSPFEWRNSSIHDYSRRGYYQPDWGGVDLSDLEAGE